MLLELTVQRKTSPVSNVLLVIHALLQLERLLFALEALIPSEVRPLARTVRRITTLKKETLTARLYLPATRSTLPTMALRCALTRLTVTGEKPRAQRARTVICVRKRHNSR